MTRYLRRRILLFIPTLLIASFVIFAVMRALPGDVTAAVLGGQGEALSPELVAAVRAEYGLDDPFMAQYGKWLWSMFNGEMGGRSLETREPIAAIVSRQAPVTLLLVIYAALGGALLAAVFSGISTLFAHRSVDALARLFTVAGGSVPGFWLAIMVVLGLVIYYRWSPPLVYLHPWQDPVEHVQIVAVPALVLAWGLGAHVTRVARGGMLEALRQEYARTDYAKGLGRWAVIRRHALRMALIPALTVAGIQVEALLSGAVLMEYIFGLPGMGRGLVQAVQARDYTLVQSLSFLLVAAALVWNLLIDVLYALIDPRISYHE